MTNIFQPEGINSNNGTTRFYNNNIRTGSRICLGFVSPGSSGSNVYTHIKTTLGGSTNTMVKFEYDGYTYASLNVHNSVTFYTYHGTSSPYDPSLVNWGESTGGIVNYYYSSDDYVVIVIQSNPQYTGGFLYVQSGYSHQNHDIDVMAYSASSNTSGVY